MGKFTFKPKQVTKTLLAVLPKRARDIVEKRFGLDKAGVPHTLESIGNEYGITRERVRQIENHALMTVAKSEEFQNAQDIFAELRDTIDALGVVVSEAELLHTLSDKKDVQNHIRLLLTLGDIFHHEREDGEFHHRWSTDESIAEEVKSALRKLYKNLNDEQLVPEAEMISTCLKELQHLNQRYLHEEIVRRWLGLSKKLGRNPLGEWGRADSPNVRAKGMRDYAYLAIKRHGSPMHFTEVAQEIERLFKRRAHVATCHNELIKDSRFVLVGRGLYALSEWGYNRGVVKEVIREILKNHGPLTRAEIIDKVRKERYVKDNTILVNLQDTLAFKRNSDGRYEPVM